MAYIGKTPVIGNFVKLDAISVVNGQASYTMQNGGANFTEYSNVNQFLVSLNGILQAPTTSFTVASSTITFASNLVTGDVIDFIIVLGNTLDVGVPSDNTVSLAKLTATGTKDSTTFLRGDNSFSTISAGITMAQQWRITASFSFSTVQDIDSNWEISDSTGYSSLGSSLTQSAGKFSFPSTGIYLILATYQFRRDTGDRGVGGNITVTTNNSTYSIVSSSETSNSDIGATENTTYIAHAQTIIDCTDTANVKFALTVQCNTTQTCDGDTNRNYTGFTCIRLGDT